MAYYAVIIDKEHKRLNTRLGVDMDDRGDIRYLDPKDFSVAEVPGTVSVTYHKSFEKDVDFLEEVTVTNTDADNMIVNDIWAIKVVDTDEPKS